MIHFAIVPTGAAHCVEPLTDMARSLVRHCKSHGENLTYPTRAGAEEAVWRMESAIDNRGGIPWANFKRVEVT